MKPAEDVAREILAIGVEHDNVQLAVDMSVDSIHAYRASVLRWAAAQVHYDLDRRLLDLLADQLDRDARADCITEVDVRAERVALPNGGQNR